MIDIKTDPRFRGLEPCPTRIWLSSPTMHGEEIKYVTPELLEWFKLDSVIVRKLDINKEGLDKLRAHPYLNFYQAKVILEYRRVRGKISSLSQLSLYEEFTEKDLKRLEPYINFD